MSGPPYASLVKDLIHLSDICGVDLDQSRFEFGSSDNLKTCYILNRNPHGYPETTTILDKATLLCYKWSYSHRNQPPSFELLSEEETTRILNDRVSTLRSLAVNRRIRKVEDQRIERNRVKAEQFIQAILDAGFTPWTSVTVGVIWKDRDEGEVLLRRRPMTAGTEFPGYWEFPGGKLNENEYRDYAMVRELKEELGVTADPHYMHWVTSTRLEPPVSRVPLILYYYTMRLEELKGELTAIEPGTAFEWVKTEEILYRPVTPGTEWFVKNRIWRLVSGSRTL